MKRRVVSGLMLLITLMLVPLTVAVTPARAQSPCSHVIFELEETTTAVNRDAVCEAAEPWADVGITTFILLTDYQPSSEDEWFNYLDQAESEAGVRRLGAADDFNRDVLALEASTGGQPFAYSITIGEQLFDSALDSDAGFSRVRNELRAGIGAGDATEAFTSALTTAYQINYPAAAPAPEGNGVATPATGDDVADVPAEQPAAGRGAATGFVVVLLVVGVLGAGATLLVVLYPRVIQPALARKQQERALREQLAELQPRVANLLNALYRLLNGETPSDSVLYQLFHVYNGEQSEKLAQRVQEWLRRSQDALTDAFDLRKKLLDPEVLAQRALEQQVRDWEMLYLTLVGSDEQIRNLSDPALQNLLNPMLVLKRETAEEAQLASQLDQIRREIEGMPLKVDLMLVDPAQVDARGILGYVDEIKTIIADLQKAQEEAPARLADAREERLGVEEELPDRPFGMTTATLFGAIDARLAQAEAALAANRFLYAIDGALEVEEALDAIRAFAAALNDHAEREAALDEITAQGYRPPELEKNQAEIAADIDQIREFLAAGNYIEAIQWIDELDSDSERALTATRAWQQLHQRNEERRQQLQTELEGVLELTDSARSAWDGLRTYPEPNWADLRPGMEPVVTRLNGLQTGTLDQIAAANNLGTQRLPEAEALLTEATAELAEAERQLRAIINRLAELQTAEANLSEGLAQTRAALAEAIAFRDREDPRIGPEVDAQLARAEQQLDEAHRLAEARLYLDAVRRQTAARQLAGDALQAAGEQVAEIKRLQSELSAAEQAVNEQVEAALAAAATLPAPVQTQETRQQLQQLGDALSQARRAEAAATSRQDRALLEMLGSALAAYTVAQQLAQGARERVAADQQSYRALHEEATQAVQRAARAVERAQQLVRHPDAGSAGRHALARAQRTIPVLPDQPATREALGRIREAAVAAEQYALEAEAASRAAIEVMQRRRQQQQLPGWPGWGVPGSGSSPWFSWGSGSGSSWSGGASRRSSRSGGSSRGSSFGGFSRRSSMGGSSRRSSMGGRSRRG